MNKTIHYILFKYFSVEKYRSRNNSWITLDSPALVHLLLKSRLPLTLNSILNNRISFEKTCEIICPRIDIYKILNLPRMGYLFVSISICRLVY